MNKIKIILLATILVLSLIFLSYGIYSASQPGREYWHSYPIINFYPDHSNGTLLVTLADPSNVNWHLINITIHGQDTIHWERINLTRSVTQYYGASAPSEWGKITAGDLIQIGKYHQNITVTIRFMPTNTLLWSGEFK